MGMRRLPLLARIQDAALAAVLAAVSVVEIWLPLTSAQGEGSRIAVTVTAVLACAALAFRRVWPLLVLLAIVVPWPVVFTLMPLPVLFWGQFAPFLVALYTVARHGRRREPLYGALAAAALLLFIDLRVPLLSSPEEIVFHWTAGTLVWLAGWGLGEFERRARSSALRAAEVEVASRTQTLTAIADERARIARELHDIVAHSMSVIALQAGTGRMVIERDTGAAREALAVIEQTSRASLSEMRQLLAVLRRDDDPAHELTPAPGLADVHALVAQLVGSGVTVDVRVEGEPDGVPAGVDLAAYRIVQEGLTNALRHSGASQVTVAVRHQPDELHLEVRDNGQGLQRTENPGHGLVGVRERVALYGGTVEVSNGSDSGVKLTATLPTGRPA